MGVDLARLRVGDEPMRTTRGSWVVRGVLLLLLVVAWRTGVLVPGLLFFAGVVSGVALTWVVARLRLGGS